MNNKLEGAEFAWSLQESTNFKDSQAR